MFEVVVTNRHIEAEDVVTFELSHPSGALLPSFSAGAHIDVQVSNGLIRQYSLCNNPEERHRYQISVLREPVSRGGSIVMHTDVHTGSQLSISEPRNNFPLAHVTGRSLLFAGGIGITPILCMAERLARIGARFELHYCTRSLARTAFFERIKQSEFYDYVHHHFDDGMDEQKLQVDQLLSAPNADTHLYVCGPGGFMEYVLAAANRAGWNEDNVHREYFTAPLHAEQPDDTSFYVKLGSSGQVIFVPTNCSIVQTLAANGIEVPVSCESGVCGTCLTRVLEGEPDHRDVFLTDAEHIKHDQMTLCCSRAKSRMLVLDL